MNKYTYLIIILLISLVSCKSEEQKLHDKIHDMLQRDLKKMYRDQDERVEKIEILSIDSITPRKQCYMVSDLYDEITLHISDSILYEMKIVELESSINATMGQMDALTSYSGADSKYGKKSSTLLKKAQAMQDYYLEVSQHYEELKKSCDTVDATTLLDYGVWAVAQINTDDSELRKDTLSFVVTKDLHIQNRRSYAAQSPFFER